ncbi:MAG: hypothetical protein ACRELF_25125, partial [Gemmataceae bacterium]
IAAAIFEPVASFIEAYHGRNSDIGMDPSGVTGGDGNITHVRNEWVAVGANRRPAGNGTHDNRAAAVRSK